MTLQFTPEFFKHLDSLEKIVKAGDFSFSPCFTCGTLQSFEIEINDVYHTSVFTHSNNLPRFEEDLSLIADDDLLDRLKVLLLSAIESARKAKPQMNFIVEVLGNLCEFGGNRYVSLIGDYLPIGSIKRSFVSTPAQRALESLRSA